MNHGNSSGNGAKSETIVSRAWDAERLGAYFELTKPRIATLLLIVAVAAFFTARRGLSIDWLGLVKTILSVGSLAAGIFALNHYMERNYDALMMRTAKRPLPSKKLSPAEALAFGLVLTVFAVLFSVFAINLLTGLIAAFIAVTYLLVYTPLKYKTAYHTALGALPGAAPPLMGWAAAVNGIGTEAWILFALLFLWQFPHFLSIELIYKDDYARAGIKVLPVVDKTGRMTTFQVVAALIALLVLSLVPFAIGMAGLVYAIAAMVFGLVFLAAGIRAVVTREKMHAKHLLRVSVLYLPLLFIVLIVNPGA